MQDWVNLLGTVTVALCALFLLRAYGRVRRRLLLWSGLCFVGLTISNGLGFYDLVVAPELNLYRWRLAIAASALLLLVFGLIFESDS